MTDNERKEKLLSQEDQVWKAVLEKNGSLLSKLFADDYLEITLEGKRVGKGEVVEQSPLVDEIEDYAIIDPQALALGEDCALLSYHLILTGKCRGEPISPTDRWVTSIWTHRTGEWLCCFFQQSHYLG